MKTNWKKTAYTVIIIATAIVIGCKKNETTQPSPTPSKPTQVTNSDNYASMADFFAKNGVQAQTYTITGSTGGNFTTPQGTVVTIPANAFLNSLSQIVTGPVTITFKDIYKKSDMLLSNMTTITPSGALLKSGGEFYIKATSAGSSLSLANTVTISQPLNGSPLDTNMKPFILTNDTMGGNNGWYATNGALSSTLTSYVYSLAQFNPPLDSGSWCNSDDVHYFSSYPQGTLTAYETDTAANYHTYVYLMFKSINTTCACHNQTGNSFLYLYVPNGMQCTIVAVGVKGGKVYSSFTPITITTNQTVNFSMTLTTTAAFEAAVNALN